MKKVLLSFLLLALAACSGEPSLQVSPEPETVVSQAASEVVPTNTPQPSPTEWIPTATEIPLTPEEQLNLPLLPESFHAYFNPVPVRGRVLIEKDGRSFYVRVLEAVLQENRLPDDEYPEINDWTQREFMKYILVTIGVEYVESEDNALVNLLSPADFAIISNGHAIPVSTSGVTLNPVVGATAIRPGMNSEGFLVGLAYEDDEAPFLRMRLDGQEYFFDLAPQDTVWSPVEIANNVVIPFEEETIGSSESPVPLGETRAWYDEANHAFFHITVDDVLRREEAADKLRRDFNITRNPPAGFEYVLPLVTIQYMGGSSETFTLDNNFFLPGMDETVAASLNLTGCVNPCLSEAQELYPGGVAKVWIPLLTPSDEPGLTLAFNEQLFFNAVKDPSQVAVEEIIIDPWIGYNSILYVGKFLEMKIPTVVFAMAVSPDNKTLAAASDDRMIYLFDLDTGDLKQTLQGHTIAVRDVAFSPDGSLLVSVSYSGEVFLWSTADWSLTAQWSQGGNGIFARFLPDGRLVTGNIEGTLRFWDVTTGEVTRMVRTPREMAPDCAEAYIHNYDVSPDGAVFIAALSCNFAVVWNPDTELKFVESNHAIESKQYPLVSAVAMAPDGTRAAYGSVYYVRYRRVFVDVWSIDEDSAFVSSSVGTATTDIPAVTWSPNGDLLVAAIGSSIHIWWPGRQNWDRPDYHFFKDHEYQITALEFSPDAMFMASGDYSGNIIVWKVFLPE